MGYASIDLAGEPEQYPIEETRRLLEKYNMKCWGAVTMVHGSRDLTSTDTQQRQNTIQYMKDVAKMCADLGGHVMTVVPSRIGKLNPSSTPQNEWRWVVESLREVAAYAQQVGVTLALEPLNRYETYLVNNIDQGIALADEIGHGCGIAFDAFHAAIEEKNLYEAIRRCGPRIMDFHVADSNRGAAGDGSFDWTKIVETVRATGYDGALAVECVPTVDRTALGGYGIRQMEQGEVDVSPEQLQFIVDHGSVVFSDEFYSGFFQRSADTVSKLIRQ